MSIDATRAGGDAMAAMVAFLGLEGTDSGYDAADRDALYRDLDTIAAICGQLDAGQRGRGVSFDVIPTTMARITANAMRLRMSGILDGLENE